jgi:sugar lactone lactonase YvrE
VADDGTLWWTGTRSGSERPADLVRFDGSGRQTFEIPEVARMGPQGTTVAPDGSVWLGSGSYDTRGNGLHRFDGTAWTRFLPQHTIFSLDIGPDGAVWFIAMADPGDNREDPGLYVITPEAVVASE